MLSLPLMALVIHNSLGDSPLVEFAARRAGVTPCPPALPQNIQPRVITPNWP